MSRRAIVIGGGHNGLIAALLLARRDFRVHLCEVRKDLGGVLSCWEFAGSQLPGLLHDTDCLSPLVDKTLQLSSRGLKRIAPPTILVPGREGGHLELAGGSIGGDISSSDLDSHRRWRRFLERVKPLLQRQLSRPVPSLELGPADLLGLGSAGLALRWLGQETMMELVRVLPMAVADWLSDQFESDWLCAALAFPTLFGSFAGPRAAGTAIQLLTREAFSGPEIQGGGAALIALLAELVQTAGVEIETSARVDQVLVEAGRVNGVRVGKRVLPADVVVATCDPVQLFLGLLDPFLLTIKQIDTVQATRSRGLIAKLHFLLDGSLELDACPGQPVHRTFLGADSVNDLEKAMDAGKYGELSSRPVLDVWVPESCRQDSKCVVSVLAYGAPFHLDGGWTKQARLELERLVLDQVESYSSGFRKRVRASELLTPADLASCFSLPGGHLCHLEQALDQFALMRPFPFANRHSTPIEGLYLAGSACHPGGWMTGLPGYLGASAVV